ncbi:restriction endonuclease [Bifidobacterium oedipodis]|uniref:Restriction endonuclease n=1 Tax=Bifidobacterium oedipodis TaxID=2675322 RepID=A0A7Y0EQS5_9BIFI|nr:restriction endonuclease [Bifidobacterium sp. DSM 109957]NMM93611.1 restriction endonuclease [Bifidobacterium sp. DSM 109957]
MDAYMDVLLNLIHSQPLWGILLVVVAVFAITVILWIAYIIWQAILRLRFSREFSVKVPSNFRIRRSGQSMQIGGFTLGYPRWEAAKRDGTRDRRTNNNRILKTPTVIRIGKWSLQCNDPFIGYALVTNLRTAGHAVGYCREEAHKRQQLVSQLQARRQTTSVDGIVAQFKTNPANFEPFCAELFRTLGWSAQPTPPTRDGGFDLKLRHPNGTTYIAECKCYDRKHHVGRPVVQKLQGANMTEHAQGMMLITTSSFSSDAIAYAAQVGVLLIDGEKLVNLCHKAWGNSATTTMFIPEREIQLTTRDIMSRIPADMRHMFY